MTAMNRIRQPFNTNSLAQVAALAALGDDAHVQKTREINEEGRKYLEAELDRMGIKHLPTQTNFIFIPLPEGASSADVFQSLLKKGVIIRPAGPSAIRVTIGLPEENRRFVDALRAWAGKAGS
jgi:histidinol-phosphate aminotransferase